MALGGRREQHRTMPIDIEHLPARPQLIPPDRDRWQHRYRNGRGTRTRHRHSRRRASAELSGIHFELLGAGPVRVRASASSPARLFALDLSGSIDERQIGRKQHHQNDDQLELQLIDRFPIRRHSPFPLPLAKLSDVAGSGITRMDDASGDPLHELRRHSRPRGSAELSGIPFDLLGRGPNVFGEF